MFNEFPHFLKFQELIYHSVAAILLLVASVYLLVKINDYKNSELYDKYIIVAVSDHASSSKSNQKFKQFSI